MHQPVQGGRPDHQAPPVVVFPGTDTRRFEQERQTFGQLAPALVEQHRSQTLEHAMLTEHPDHASLGIDHEQMAKAGGIHAGGRFGHRDIDGNRLQTAAHHVAQTQR
ncbi:MAG: hypothetical protein CVU34_13990 [Betaproteobacteria bacterium HGW-Betaproteobacteria-7]|nr:MAG: hypothetical protein CVU34_13990 [Betaproteobacteria bacterium HGW-Betaproteobacteria-7]